MTPVSRLLVASLLGIVPFIAGCGGGGGSDEADLLIQGTLTEAGGASHSKSLLLRHSEGQRIEEVEICALGACSTTDADGQWGFVVGDEFTGGEVLFTVNGHGIETTSVVDIPSGASDVFIDFQHVEGGAVEAHHVTVDGETEHLEDHHE